MKAGDLVKFGNGWKLGLVIDIDPLREDALYKYDKINEIVILNNGSLWYTGPSGWEVISEAP